MIEQVLADYDRAYGLRSLSLRYFNAAGADSQARAGERHEPETHLIPLILQTAMGRRKAITVYGRDYETPDGTCIRDYIHVSDLCDAHARALRYLEAGGASCACNLGNGAGYSVQQVIAAAQTVTGEKINVVDGQRRAGDPARLVADAALARKLLQWRPQRASLETMIGDAWQWMRGGPHA
jgi:UDP-glucose 4-epimerase